MNQARSFFPKSLELDSSPSLVPEQRASHTVFPPSVSSAGEGRSANMTRRNPGRTALLLCQAETRGQPLGTVRTGGEARAMLAVHREGGG